MTIMKKLLCANEMERKRERESDRWRWRKKSRVNANEWNLKWFFFRWFNTSLNWIDLSLIIQHQWNLLINRIRKCWIGTIRTSHNQWTEFFSNNSRTIRQHWISTETFVWNLLYTCYEEEKKITFIWPQEWSLATLK